MSDTATTTEAKAPAVVFGLQEVASIPKSKRAPSTGQVSQALGFVEQIKGMGETAVGKAFQIGKGKGVSLTQVAQSLRSHIGHFVEDQGWGIWVRQLDDGSSGLFVTYDPSKVDPAVAAEKAKASDERRAKAKVTREANKAKKDGSGASQGTPTPAPAKSKATAAA